MLGRLIQNNPFCLKKIDELFFNIKNNKNLDKIIITEYFEYIKSKITDDSIFRLLSPILQIFFGIPNSKKVKIEIHKKMQNHEIDGLENLFLKFLNDQKESIFI